MLVILGSGKLCALERMSDSVEAYEKGRYQRALTFIEKFLEDYPRDATAVGMRNIIRERLALMHLKKAYTLRAEGLDAKASEQIDKAYEYSAEFADAVEEKYSEYLNESTKSEAADMIIRQLISDPRPEASRVNEIKRQIRERLFEKLNEEEIEDITQLKKRVEELKAEKEWSLAVELISRFISDNPGMTEPKLMLSEINRLAAEDFYARAMEYALKRAESKARDMAREAEMYDQDILKEKSADGLKEALEYIKEEKEEEAIQKLNALAVFDVEGINPQAFLSLLEQQKSEDLIREGMDLYSKGEFENALAVFDLLKTYEPDNDEIRLYYYLSSARINIQKREFEEVRENLIKALEISPGEREAVEIFDRLQEVMEIMGTSL
ncbi:MAG: hypothetical protein ACQESB_00035 [Elusimicrobiota bacterium]